MHPIRLYRGNEFLPKFSHPVATRMVKMQNPILKFLKTMKGNIQERIYESDQWCLIGITLSLWPKCSLMHVGKKIWFSGGLVEIIRWFCNMILMSNKITLVDSSLWSLSILTKNIFGRPTEHSPGRSLVLLWSILFDAN